MEVASLETNLTSIYTGLGMGIGWAEQMLQVSKAWTGQYLTQNYSFACILPLHHGKRWGLHETILDVSPRRE